MRLERPPRRRRNGIIITSLVDVMFVLLFFFMLASSYADWRTVAMDLGGAGKAPPGALAKTWAVQVLQGGQFALDGEPMSLPQISGRLRAAAGGKVVLQPGPNVPLQDLVSTLDILRPTGASLVLGKLPQ